MIQLLCFFNCMLNKFYPIAASVFCSLSGGVPLFLYMSSLFFLLIMSLTIGYLKEQQCSKAAEYFLRDNCHLAEYRSMLKQGFSAPLTIGGRTLVEVLCLCQIEKGNGVFRMSMYLIGHPSFHLLYYKLLPANLED